MLSFYAVHTSWQTYSILDKGMQICSSISRLLLSIYNLGENSCWDFGCVSKLKWQAIKNHRAELLNSGWHTGDPLATSLKKSFGMKTRLSYLFAMATKPITENYFYGVWQAGVPVSLSVCFSGCVCVWGCVSVHVCPFMAMHLKLRFIVIPSYISCHRHFFQFSVSDRHSGMELQLQLQLETNWHI